MKGEQHKYPIKFVSKVTGLTAFIIRAWEKRYNVVEPERTETNRRLYSDKDIEKLKLLREAIERGHNIGGIAGLTTEELYKILDDKNLKIIRPGIIAKNNLPADTDSILDKCVTAVKIYDGKALENYLFKAAAKLSQPKLIEELIIPLVYRIGDLWHDGQLRVANEHLASTVIRSFLSHLIDQYIPAENAPLMISATPRGQEHEFGAMIAGVIASSSGWKVIYLGVDLPVEEIASVAETLEARVVSLSIVYPSDDPLLNKDLLNLKKMLPDQVSVIVGGRAAGAYLEVLNSIGAIIVNNSKQLKTELDALRVKSKG